jgi:transposase-like protein
MPRHAPVLEYSPEDKEALVAISKSRNEELRLVERAQIILASLEGKQIQEVARELGLSIPTVDKWRRRFS